MKKMSKRLLSVVLTLVMVLSASSVFAAETQSEESAVSAGGTHSLAVKSDGTVLAWGLNYEGQLGNGTTDESSVPVLVTDLKNVSEVAAGLSHSLALKSDGTVWAWGSNDYGQLGNGISGVEEDENEPVQVKNLTNVVAIAAGLGHSLAVKSDGTVWAWGYNDEGQLGNDTETNSTLPVQVIELTDVIAVSAGAAHSLALKSDGSVWAWGDNGSGQLGNGTTSDSSVPVLVTDWTDVIAISAGSQHSLAVKKNGTVWAWGWNNNGQLGNGSTDDSSVPVQVEDLTNVIEVSAALHSLALKSDGTVWSWGRNESGQLGNGTTVVSKIPVQVSDLTNVITVSAGSSHSLALKSDNTVWAWGSNDSGELGDASPISDVSVSETTPIQAAGESGKGYLKLDSTSINYTDVAESAWYYNAVQFSAENDLLVGTSTTAFEPSTNMTRGMVAMVLYKMEDTPDVDTTAYFTDVTNGAWYTDAVNWAYANDVISGYGNGTFGPDDNISREQFATMMRNFADYKKLDVSGEADLSKYTDSEKISSWATNAMKWAVHSELISGTSDTTLDPAGTATRAQCAAILMNWMNNIAA